MSPGRLGAVSSSEISSLSTMRKASVRKVGLNPISTSAPSYLHGKLTVASPASGERLVSTTPFFEKAIRTPLLSSVVSNAGRRMAHKRDDVEVCRWCSGALGLAPAQVQKQR